MQQNTMNTNHTNPANKPSLTRWAIVASVTAAIAALALTFAPSAFAQTDKAGAAPTPRYQVSSWAFGSEAGKGERGCYIIDSSTGELWVAHADGAPKKIGEKLK